jgi:hypothetical protein
MALFAHTEAGTVGAGRSSRGRFTRRSTTCPSPSCSGAWPWTCTLGGGAAGVTVAAVLDLDDDGKADVVASTGVGGGRVKAFRGPSLGVLDQ